MNDSAPPTGDTSVPAGLPPAPYGAPPSGGPGPSPSAPYAWQSAPPPFAPPVPQRSGPPGLVHLAAVLTYVSAGLTLLGIIAIALIAAFIGSLVGDAFEAEDTGFVVTLVISVVLVGTALCLLGCWLAWRMSRRSNTARIALAAWSGVVAIPGILSLSPIMLVSALNVAVVVLLFLPEVNDWFRGEG